MFIRVDFPDPEHPSMAVTWFLWNDPLTFFKTVFFSVTPNSVGNDIRNIYYIMSLLCITTLTGPQCLRHQRIPNVDRQGYIDEFYVDSFHLSDVTFGPKIVPILS